MPQIQLQHQEYLITLKYRSGVFGYLVGSIAYIILRFQDIDKTELRLLVDNWQVFLPLLIIVMVSTYLIYDK